VDADMSQWDEVRRRCLVRDLQVSVCCYE
jgi:hypothetical protein